MCRYFIALKRHESAAICYNVLYINTKRTDGGNVNMSTPTGFMEYKRQLWETGILNSA